MVKELIIGSMKMAELIDVDYTLIGVLDKFNVPFGFGESTVDDICRQQGLDTAAFTLICNMNAIKGYTPSDSALAKADPRCIIDYLHASHDYYIHSVLEVLSKSLADTVEPCDETRKAIIRKFYEGYKVEINKHFEFEEKRLFPYVDALLQGKKMKGASFQQIEKNHGNIDEKLGDLKNIVMKYLPKECDNKKVGNVLVCLYMLKEELARHTSIEDKVLIPMVKTIESNG